jgi:hypothetical protein
MTSESFGLTVDGKKVVEETPMAFFPAMSAQTLSDE